MGTRQQNETLDVLRWIGFLPVAGVAAWLAWIVVNILGRFSLGFVGIGPEDFQGKLYFMTAGLSMPLRHVTLDTSRRLRSWPRSFAR